MSEPPFDTTAETAARPCQRGVSLSVWTAVAIPAFIIAVGIGVDFSGHAAAQQEARSVAGQAARAATHEVILADGGVTLDVAAGRQAATRFAADAGYPAVVSIQGTRADVTVEGAYRTLFLGLIGVNEIGFTASGSASAYSTIDGRQG